MQCPQIASTVLHAEAIGQLESGSFSSVRHLSYVTLSSHQRAAVIKKKRKKKTLLLFFGSQLISLQINAHVNDSTLAWRLDSTNTGTFCSELCTPCFH